MLHKYGGTIMTDIENLVTYAWGFFWDHGDCLLHHQGYACYTVWSKSIIESDFVVRMAGATLTRWKVTYVPMLFCQSGIFSPKEAL